MFQPEPTLRSPYCRLKDSFSYVIPIIRIHQFFFGYYTIEDPRNRSNHVIPTTIRIIQWILTNCNLYSRKIAFVSLVSKPKNTNSQRW